jgi:hypothetical protein
MPATACGHDKVPRAKSRRPPNNPALNALLELRELVASEGYAMTALTLAGYRRDLLATFDNYLKDCTS